MAGRKAVGAAMTKLAGDYPLTQEKCLEAGGHCYKDMDSAFTGRQHYRVCKHCGNYQRGTEQERIRWEDAP